MMFQRIDCYGDTIIQSVLDWGAEKLYHPTMIEEESRSYPPLEALTLLKQESGSTLLIDPDASEYSQLDTMLIDDANAKIESFVQKKYTSKKTWEKVISQLNFKQFAYIVMSNHPFIEQLDESKIRSALYSLASVKRNQFLDFRFNNPGQQASNLQLERHDFARDQIKHLDNLRDRLLPQKMKRNSLPSRARR